MCPQFQRVAEVADEQSQAFTLVHAPSFGKEAHDRELMGLGDSQAVGVRCPRFDQADLETILDALEAFAQQQVADAAVPVGGVNGQATELPDEVGMGADLQVHGSRADDSPRLGILGHEKQAVVGVDQPGQQRLVVVAGVRVIGPVGCQEDLADRGNVPASRLSDGDHGCSSDGTTPACPCSAASGESPERGARSRRTSRAQRSTSLRNQRLLVGGVGAVADRPQAVEGGGVLARCVAVGGAADRRLVEFQSQATAEIPSQAP